MPLTDGTVATVPTFYVEAILVAFLNDPLQMREENFAPNYNIFMGKAKETTLTLGEVLNFLTHTYVCTYGSHIGNS